MRVRCRRPASCLRKALEKDLRVVLVINKIDRADARPKEVVDEVYELFLDLDAADNQIEFPILYCNARAGHASFDAEHEGDDLEPLFAAIRDHIPPPEFEEGHPLQALVTNLDASPYLGRLALCRVLNGTIRRSAQVAWCRADGRIENIKISELYVTEGLERVAASEAGPGEIIAVAGLDDVTIGETLADPLDPRPLPVLTVDEPSLSMTIGTNTSPISGRDGAKVTARLLKNRLDAELVGNVSIRIAPTERPDTWEVHGRGELQLAVLVELLRREGFELTVGQAPGGDPDDRRQAARAGGARLDRRAGGVSRRRDPARGIAQGAPRADGQPRHRLGAPRVRRPVAGADRVPDRVHDRDAGDGRHPPRLRPLRAVVRRSCGSARAARSSLTAPA